MCAAARMWFSAHGDWDANQQETWFSRVKGWDLVLCGGQGECTQVVCLTLEAVQQAGSPCLFSPEQRFTAGLGGNQYIAEGPLYTNDVQFFIPHPLLAAVTHICSC